MIAYSDEFIQKIRDYAVLGLYPSQIAERMGLIGEARRKFLEDIHTENNPLHVAYSISFDSYKGDIDGALNSAALTGDSNALRIVYELNQQDRVDQLKQDLFGI
ncbi:MAG: hypothetical protein ACI3ZQ_04950 [Candidatus Cryptobacteroides sp.]